MITVDEAILTIKEQTKPLSLEFVDLENALGRFLAEDVVADSDLPPFDRSQMDGYAVRAADTQDAPVQLYIAGESVAGAGWHNEMLTGQAVRIMTGAPVPKGADAVQQVELTRELDGGSTVEIQRSPDLGKSIVRRASEIRAGETVLQSGEQINASMMAVLAAFGYAQVSVRRKPRVAVIATGGELVSVSQKPGTDQIRDSNNYSIGAYATLAGAIVKLMPLTGDSPTLLKRQISAASKNSDVIITSGGVSMGRFDFTKTVLNELDAKIFFERVALRPGKPIVFAQLPNGVLLFGLPGNPVSVSVTFNLFARTSLWAMQGAHESALAEEWAILERTVKGSVDRESYLPGRIRTGEAGHMLAKALNWGGSSDFVAFARANGLIKVPPGVARLEIGSTVRVLRLPS
ncbi:MAG: molybdopterin molybdotransferase MoeA [Pyrinomonadaceae bacterium]|nr:molybdopterin molybdotransferase MoeA [Pyrinomonadaceae bacterium]